KGTGQPGLHVHVDVVPSLGRYVAGRNTPFYGDDLGPHCYSVPFRGITLNDGAGPAPRTETSRSGAETGRSRQPAATRQPGGAGQRARTTSALAGLAALGGTGLVN